MESKQAAAQPQQIVQLIKEKLARTVRSNARKDAALTPLHATSSLPGISLEKRRAIAAEITADSDHSDIRSVTTSGGLVFLYSASYLSPAEAAVKAMEEQTKLLICEKVRKESRERVVLTSLATLGGLFKEMTSDRLEAILEEMQAEPRYQDLKTVAGCRELYFYSQMHMTDKYAALAARVADKEPCAVVADTVREESRFYPRPTNIQVFKSQVYGIPHHSLEATITEVLQNPAYADIRKIVGPASGAVYLYSEKHMSERDALSSIRNEECGQR